MIWITYCASSNLPLLEVVQDLQGTDPEQETCATVVYGRQPPGTLPRSYRSGIYLYLSAPKYLDHQVAMICR